MVSRDAAAGVDDEDDDDGACGGDDSITITTLMFLVTMKINYSTSYPSDAPARVSSMR